MTLHPASLTPEAARSWLEEVGGPIEKTDRAWLDAEIRRAAEGAPRGGRCGHRIGFAVG